jgi:hypothetical protein
MPRKVGRRRDDPPTGLGPHEPSRAGLPDGAFKPRPIHRRHHVAVEFGAAIELADPAAVGMVLRILPDDETASGRSDRERAGTSVIVSRSGWGRLPQWRGDTQCPAASQSCQSIRYASIEHNRHYRTVDPGLGTTPPGPDAHQRHESRYRGQTAFSCAGRRGLTSSGTSVNLVFATGPRPSTFENRHQCDYAHDLRTESSRAWSASSTCSARL